MNVLKEINNFIDEQPTEEQPSIEIIAQKARDIMDLLQTNDINNEEVGKQIMDSFPTIDSSWWAENWDEIVANIAI